MASPTVKKAITEAALNYTKPEGAVFQYGTAGVSGFFINGIFANGTDSVFCVQFRMKA